MKKSSMPSIPPYHNLTIQKELKEGSKLYKDRGNDQKEESNHVVEKKEEPVAETNSKKVELEKKPSMDINESAEAFINKFRQQLLIQRLESIENYEQMLARGL
ncbi:uncharacterized protein LOC107408349 [Ziziphus jujuba]|uniref:Uncharacterized protein LOC107408349 n=2 Tax=Ziziphus jujuba TaxID=326968 RepID=A0A6P3Z3C3_ZIZJJ|nr:uncharacterized protein LOC107408349 [Ziziphus jujuba]KAH7547379.1 hypothetical protein FEM48_Zijuj01G0303500 [Ziziphus jujuba var. spinosa]